MSDPTHAHDEVTQPTEQPKVTQPSATPPPTTPPMVTPPTTQRAEEIVDHAGERVGYFASSMAQRIRIATARAREEAEDMWAEAQSIRRKKGT